MFFENSNINHGVNVSSDPHIIELVSNHNISEAVLVELQQTIQGLADPILIRLFHGIPEQLLLTLNNGSNPEAIVADLEENLTQFNNSIDDNLFIFTDSSKIDPFKLALKNTYENAINAIIDRNPEVFNNKAKLVIS